MVKTEFAIHSDYLSGPGKIYFTHQDVILVYIEPEETVNLRTSSDLEDTLQKKIEAMYQERCTQEGYVVRNHKRLSSASQDMCKIRIVSRDPAYAAGEHFNGSWVYKVFFKYLVCNPSPQSILPAVGSHHERLDGTGYPRGLKGDQIPLIARIVAVADAYDAMTSDRAYRAAMSHKKAVDELHKSVGTHFDGRVVEALIRAIEGPDTPSEN